MNITNDYSKKYTIIKPDPELKNNLMAFGFEIGKGWMPLLIELIDKIQMLVNNNPEYADVEILQVKEKYGSLRVYLNYYYKEIEELIQEYEEKSCYICEECGGKGEIRNINNWYTALCDKHYAEYKEK